MAIHNTQKANLEKFFNLSKEDYAKQKQEMLAKLFALGCPTDFRKWDIMPCYRVKTLLDMASAGQLFWTKAYQYKQLFDKRANLLKQVSDINKKMWALNYISVTLDEK